jgi:ribosomal protein S18 acetylase RimI-like enzyme
LQNYGARDLEFIIRQCRIGDETALSLLGKATFLETYAGTAEAADILAHIETEHSAESFRTWLQSDSAKIWVAETSVGRSAIGYAVALTPQNNGFCVEMEIKRLYVLYRFPRNGLGHSLMNEVLVTARKNRAAGLFLKVEKANQNAIAFYSRIGFHVVGKKPFRAGERDYTVLVMRLAF